MSAAGTFQAYGASGCRHFWDVSFTFYDLILPPSPFENPGTVDAKMHAADKSAFFLKKMARQGARPSGRDRPEAASNTEAKGSFYFFFFWTKGDDTAGRYSNRFGRRTQRVRDLGAQRGHAKDRFGVDTQKTRCRR